MYYVRILLDLRIVVNQGPERPWVVVLIRGCSIPWLLRVLPPLLIVRVVPLLVRLGVIPFFIVLFLVGLRAKSS